jgi:hypothetical protein
VAPEVRAGVVAGGELTTAIDFLVSGYRRP